MFYSIELDARLASIQEESSDTVPEFLQDFSWQKVFTALIILTIAYIFLLGARTASNWLSERVPLRFRPAAKQSVPFLQAMVIGGAIIYVLSLFVKLSPDKVIALTGTVAVALGFAFKDYASSLIAGVVALFETPYRVGDRVQIGDNYGEVVQYGLRGIRLKTVDDNIIFIPHNKIWTEPISNANNGDLEAQVTTDFYLAHGVDTELVIKILFRAAYTSKYTQLTLPVQVIIEEQVRGTNFKLKCYPMDARDEFIYKT
ncbi:MAG: mechanosensitive ion channel, partial [Okeania sp. SIO2H7]|nr:mechanosensitive ion channel [Okeania sp. SIO2H7]